MATSTLQGRVRTSTTESSGDDQPLDTVVVKDAIVGSLLHMADSHVAQVRVAWIAPNTTVSGAQGYIVPPAYGTDTPVFLSAFGPFPIPVRASGKSYRLRVRVAGSSSGGAACKFYVCMVPAGSPVGRTDATELTDAHLTTVTTVSSSAAWLAGTSNRNAYNNVIEADPARVELARRVFNTIKPGGATISGERTEFQIYVFGSTANAGTSAPRLHGLVAQEYVG